ncbi:FIST C-terminal domain-containing protein [Limibacillus sp. MBR-115]|jgi:small ligand-binding sensory domain FIST|uniref:FIST signal transduction protein n=1 Tax=Limibacillus sp. MBR-115 TaxID=3156465 RepID=UPI00339B68CD
MTDGPTGIESVFVAGRGQGADWSACLSAALAEIGRLPDQANIGFIYATDELAKDWDDILVALRSRTSVDNWLGTVGVGVAASGWEAHDQPALVLLIGRLPEEDFRVFGPLVDSLSELETKHGAWLGDKHPTLALVHADPTNPHIADMIPALSQVSGCFLVGGLTASRSPSQPQAAGGAVTGGLSGVFFGSRVLAATALSQGCTALGDSHVITAADQNVIETLDGRPAYEVLRETVGELLMRDPRRLAGYITVGFPISGSDTGDYLVRNLVGLDPNSGLVAVGEEVTVGQRVFFARRDPQSAVRDLCRMLEGIESRIEGVPKAGIYVSCSARGPHLFGVNSEELKLVREVLGDFPLVGFYAGGEISNDRLYAYTGVLTLLL